MGQIQSVIHPSPPRPKKTPTMISHHRKTTDKLPDTDETRNIGNLQYNGMIYMYIVTHTHIDNYIQLTNVYTTHALIEP